MSNLFKNLDVDDTEYDPKKNERKARKALIAIEKLKKMCNLTEEEKIKLEGEDNWRRILDPLYVNISKQEQNKETEKDCEMREKKKMKRNEKKRKRIDEQEQEQRRNSSRYEEQQQRSRYEEQQQRSRYEEQNPISPLEKRVHHEIKVRCKLERDKKKAYKQMYLKYHPDKNMDKNATLITQIINKIKENENM